VPINLPAATAEIGAMPQHEGLTGGAWEMAGEEAIRGKPT
jgi:hypothetical protein